MADLKNKITFDTAGAISNIKSLSSALTQYNSTAKGATTSAATSFDTSAKSIVASSKYLKSATSAGFLGVGVAARKAAVETKKASGDMILSWKSVIRIFAIQVIHQGISKITSKLSASAEEARDYAKQLAEIQTIGPGFKKDFAGLDQQVKDFSKLTGFSLDKSTSGLYQTLSNQVAATGDEFNFMGSAAKLAIAGVSDLDGSVNLLSSVINSYRKSSAEADDISGKLFKTVELGRLRIDNIANSYGRVLGISSQLGVPLEEVNASMATLTSTGMDHNESMTLITNTQLKLIKPTNKLKEVFNKIGVVSAEAGIQAFGFQGFLQEISKHGGSSATEMGKLYGRVRAVRGALGLTNDQAERYAENLRKIKGAGAETVTDAKKLIFETNAKQLELEFNEISVAVTSFGQTFNSVLLTVIQAAGGGVAAVKAISASAIVGGLVWAGYKIAALASFKAIIAGTFGVKAALLALAASPAGIAIAVAAVIAAAVVGYSLMSNAAEKSFKKVREASKEATKQIIKDTVKRNKNEQDSYNKLASDFQKSFTTRIKAEEKATEEASLTQAVAIGGIKDSMNSTIGAVEAYFESLKSFAKGAEQAILNIGLAISGISSNLEDWKFDRQQKRWGDANKEVFARIKKAQELSKKAQAAEAKGNNEEAAHFRTREQHYLKRALAIADQVGNASLIKRSEDAYETSVKNQIKHLEHKKKITEKIAKTAKSDLVGSAATVRTLKGIQEKVIKALAISSDLSPAEIAAQKKRALHFIAQFEETVKGKVKFSDIIADINVKDKIKLRQQFDDISVGIYDNFLKQTVSMEKATVEAFSRIGSSFSKHIAGVDPKEKTLGLTGTTKERSKQLLEFGKTVAKGTSAEQDSAIARGQISERDIKNAQELIKLNELIAQGTVGGDLSTAKRRGPAALFGQSEGYEKLQQTGQKARDAINLITEAQKTGAVNTKEYAQAFESLKESITELPEAKAARTLLGIADPKEILKKITERLEESQAFRKTVKDLEPAIEAKDVITDRVIKIQAEDAATGVINEIQGVLDGLTDKKITVFVDYVKTGKLPDEKHFGGIYRAFGGRGHDRIPAMLSRGEFVMNAGATRKMYSQLVSANSSYRYLGGPASNNNTTFNNTFNVTGAASPQQTAREIQKLIQRENRIRK